MSDQQEWPSYKGIVVFVENTYGSYDEQQVGIYTRTGVIKADVPKACSVGKVITYYSNGIISTVKYPVEYEDPGFSQLSTTEIQGSLVVRYNLLVSGTLDDEPIYYSHPVLNQVLVPKSSCFTRGDEISIIAAYMDRIEDFIGYHMIAIGWIDAKGGWIPFNWEKVFENKEMRARIKEIYNEYKQKVHPGRYSFLSSNNIERMQNRFSTFGQRHVEELPVNDPNQPGTSKASEKWEKMPEEPKIVSEPAFDMNWINKREQPAQSKPERVREAAPKQAGTLVEDEDADYLKNILNQASSAPAAEKEAKPKYSDEHLQIKSEIARKVHAQLIKGAADPEYIMPRTTYILEFIAKSEGLPKSFGNQPDSSKISSRKEPEIKAPKIGRGVPKFLHEDIKLSPPVFERDGDKASMARYGKSNQGFETGSTSKPEAFYPKQRESVNNEDNDAFDFDLSSQHNSDSHYIVQEPATPTESNMIGQENSQWNEQRNQSGSTSQRYDRSYQQGQSRSSENYGHFPSNRQTQYTHAQPTRQSSSSYQQPQKQYRLELKDQQSPSNQQYGFFNANRQPISRQTMYDGPYDEQQQTHFHDRPQQNRGQTSVNRDHFHGTVQEHPRQQGESSFNRSHRGTSFTMTQEQHDWFWDNFELLQQQYNDLPSAFKFACDEFEELFAFSPLSDESFYAPPLNMTPDQEKLFWSKFMIMQKVHPGKSAGAMEFTCRKFANGFGGRQLAIEAPPRQQSVRAIQAPRDFENRNYQGEQHRLAQHDDRHYSNEYDRQRRSDNYQFEQQSRQSQRDYQNQSNYRGPHQHGNYNDQYEQEDFYNNQGRYNTQNRQHNNYSDSSRRQQGSAFQSYSSQPFQENIDKLHPRFFQDPSPNRKQILPVVEDVEDVPVYQTGRRLPKSSREPQVERAGPDSYIRMTENMRRATEKQKVLESELLEQEYDNSVGEREFMPISARRQRNQPVQDPRTSRGIQNVAPPQNKVFTNQNFENSSDDSSEDEEETPKQVSSRHSRQSGTTRKQRRYSVSSEDEPKKVSARQAVSSKPNPSVPQPSKTVQQQPPPSMATIRKVDMYASGSDDESDECSDEDDISKTLRKKR